MYMCVNCKIYVKLQEMHEVTAVIHVDIFRSSLHDVVVAVENTWSLQRTRGA